MTLSELQSLLYQIQGAINARIWQEQENDSVIPSNAKYLPGLKIGDKIFSYEFDVGLGTHVLVWDDGEHQKFIDSDDPKHIYWVWDEIYATAEEAMRAEFESEIEYCEERLNFAKEGLRLLAAGEPVPDFSRL